MQKYLHKNEESFFRVAILVSPQAFVSQSAQLIKGIIVEPMAVVQANTMVAIGCIVSWGAVIGHDSFVGDGVHCDSNSVVESCSIVYLQERIFDAELCFRVICQRKP